MFGIDSIKFRCTLMRNSIPDLIKRVSSAAIFKKTLEIGMERNVTVKYVDYAS